MVSAVLQRPLIGDNGSMSLERELRDTSDSLVRALDRLQDLEAEKREVPTGTPHFVKLAQQIEDLAIEVLRRTEREAALAQDTEERREAGGGVGRAIQDTPPSRRDLTVILTEWRAAERRLASAEASGPESSAAAADVRRLREEYRNTRETRELRQRE